MKTVWWFILYYGELVLKMVVWGIALGILVAAYVLGVVLTFKYGLSPELGMYLFGTGLAACYLSGFMYTRR